MPVNPQFTYYCRGGVCDAPLPRFLLYTVGTLLNGLHSARPKGPFTHTRVRVRVRVCEWGLSLCPVSRRLAKMSSTLVVRSIFIMAAIAAAQLVTIYSLLISVGNCRHAPRCFRYRHTDSYLCFSVRTGLSRFYRAMHYSAKRGLAIACRLSVRLRRSWIMTT